MKKKSKEPAVSAPRCPVCQTELTRHGLVLCQKCHTPHHRRCWSYNKGCGVFGCECRVLVLPKIHREVEEPDSRLHFDYQWVYPSDRFGALWAMLLMVVFFWNAQLFLPVLFAVLLPLALSTRHTVNLDTGMLERRHLLGPLTVWRRESFLPLHQIETLELRRRYPVKDPDEKGRSVWEVWVRDLRDRATLLEVTRRCKEEAVLTRLEASVDSMDTVVTMPRGSEAEGELPAGLQATIDRLPADEFEEALEEIDAGEEET